MDPSVSVLEELHNECHDAKGRFCTAEQARNLQVAEKILTQAQDIVGVDTQEGIVLNHVRKNLSLHRLGLKVIDFSLTLQQKFAKADEWLKTDPQIEKVSLVQKFVSKAKEALSYISGGNLGQFLYQNTSGLVLGLAVHFAMGVGFNWIENAKVWPPPAWGAGQ